MRHDPTSAFSVPRSFFASPPTSLLSLLALACLFSSLLFSCVGMDRTKEYLCSGGCPSWAACRTNDTFCRFRCSEPNPSRGDCYCSSTNECASSEICKQNACRTCKDFHTDKCFVAGGTTFAVRYVSAGFFFMGSPTSDAEAFSNEQPQRRVQISKGFWILETEVTQGQYKALVGSNPSYFSSCGDNCPVESVSWYEARAFADKLSEAQSLPPCTSEYFGIFQCQGWRLPTEAEWEYAARADITEPRPGHLSDVAWYSGNSGSNTQPVGVKEANAWGLHDMLGNVWEWTMDIYENSYNRLDTSDPLRTGEGFRVGRGGSWNNGARNARSAMRYGFQPSLRYNDLGFRLLRY